MPFDARPRPALERSLIQLNGGRLAPGLLVVAEGPIE
jgi:hypothetical protein